jgi:hypothetical protein
VTEIFVGLLCNDKADGQPCNDILGTLMHHFVLDMPDKTAVRMEHPDHST